MELGDSLLQPLVLVLRAADERHEAEAEAVRVMRFLGGLFDTGKLSTYAQ